MAAWTEIDFDVVAVLHRDWRDRPRHRPAAHTRAGEAVASLRVVFCSVAVSGRSGRRSQPRRELVFTSSVAAEEVGMTAWRHKVIFGISAVPIEMVAGFVVARDKF